MKATHADELISGYLARLEIELADAAPARRREIVEDMRAHIDEARGALPDQSDAQILNLLDRLGEPAQLAADALENKPISSTRSDRDKSSNTLEILAVVLLPLIWPAGVVLLWISPRWTYAQKALGTLVVPGGYAAVLGIYLPILMVAGTRSCFGGGTTTDQYGHVTTVAGNCPTFVWTDLIMLAILVFLLFAPTLVAIYLGRKVVQMRRRAQTTAGAGAV